MIMIGNSYEVGAQLIINNSYSAKQLVEDFFVGSGVQVSNVTLNGQTQITQLGAFTNTNTKLDLSSGILLSTGYSNHASINGTNTNSSFTSQGINCAGGTSGLCLAGDSDLNNILGNTTYDAAVLEFDFIPTSDTIRFKYVFASEEYNEYACTQYNDVFAFLLSSSSMPQQNIALVPNTTRPVAINMINNGTVGLLGSVSNCSGSNGSLNYSNLFKDNSGGPFIQFDGMTTALEAVAAVQPCQTYHIKLVVADAIDGAFDSGVFLEANSFSSDIIDVSLQTPNDDSIVVENCNIATITLSLNNNVTSPYPITYNVLGTASNGADYQNLSGVSTIVTGQKSVDITIQPISDNVFEGTETIILEIQTSPCHQDTVTIFLNDEVLLDQPNVSCMNANAVSITYNWLAVPNAIGYRVTYNNGLSWDTLAANQLQYTVYGLFPNTNAALWVQPLGGYSICTPHPIDTGSCSTLPCNITGQLINAVNVTCFGGSDGSITVQQNGGRFPFQYFLDNTLPQNSPNFQNISAGHHIITIIDADSCIIHLNFTLSEPPAISIISDSLLPTLCVNSIDGAAYFSANNGIGNYTYTVNSISNTTGIFKNLAEGKHFITVTDSNNCTSIDSFIIQSPTPIILTSSSTPTLCKGENTGTALVFASGGTVNNQYQYLWNNNQNTAQAINLSAGQYQVTITDDNGCFDTTSISITEPNDIQFTTIQIDSTSCFGTNDGSANVIATGGNGNFSYRWSNGDLVSNITNVSAGQYQINATDDKGCQDSMIISIEEPLIFEITQIDAQHISCFGAANGSATLHTNETGNMTYFWSPSGQNTLTATNLNSGWHYVAVTNVHGCEAHDSIFINEPNPINTITQVIQSASCFNGSDGQAIVMISGGTPFYDNQYQYLWNTSPSQTTAIATNLTGGLTYSVTVTDSLGCSMVNSILMTHPSQLTATPVVTDVFCYNGNDGSASVNIVGGTPNYQYQWSNNTNNSTVNQLSAGVYYLTVTDLNNCTSITSFEVHEPTALTLDIQKQDVFCKSEATGQATALVAGGSPNYHFQWNDNQQSNHIENLITGWYYLTVTDDHLCEIKDSIFINEPQNTLQATFIKRDVTCFGDRNGQIAINVNGGILPYQYSLDGENYTNAHILAGLSADTYPIFIRDNNGCIFDTITTIEEPLAIELSAGIDQLLKWGEKTTISTILKNAVEPLTYEWSPPNGLSCLDCTAPIASPLQETFYSVKVIDARGCTAMDKITIRIIKSNQIYVPTAFSPNNNGVNDFLFVQSDENQVRKVLNFKIYNRWGEMVFEARDIPPNAPTFGWNGYFKGKKRDSNVVTWTAEVEFMDGETSFFKGHTTLIK